MTGVRLIDGTRGGDERAVPVVSPGDRWPRMPECWAPLSDVLCSGTWTDGPWTKAVEQLMCRVTGAPFAVAFNSCTSAIHATLAAQGTRQGDPVTIPSFTFVGSATGATHLGARLVLLDVRPDTLTLDWTHHTPGAAAVPVALHGVPVEPPLRGLVDACQALGTIGADGRHIGGTGTYAWSFSASKLVAAPDGGAVTTDDATLAELLRRYRDYGIGDPDGAARANQPVTYPLGHNWRASEVSMCLVADQLTRLHKTAARAHVTGERIRAALVSVGWRTQADAGARVAWQKIRTGAPPGADPYVTDWLLTHLAAAGVPTHRWGTPLHRMRGFDITGGHRPCPVAEEAAAFTFCIGTETSPPWTWSDDEVSAVVDTIERTPTP